MQKTKVSIIIPVYNSEKFLQKCLDSIVNQTLQEIEIICINDGSQDNSRKILQDYKDKDSRITIIDQENGGLSAARNSGLKIVKGEYIGFVDSDDWVAVDFFEKLYNTAVKHNADIAITNVIRVHRSQKQENYLIYDNETVTDDYLTKLKLCDIPDKCYVWNKIYKTEEFKKNNLKFTEGRMYEDLEFTPRMLYYLKKLVTVPDTYYYYLSRDNSIIKLRTPKAVKDKLWAKKEARHFAKEHGVNLYNLQTITKKFKFFGVTMLKVSRKNNVKTYNLFNLIKWQT